MKAVTIFLIIIWAVIVGFPQSPGPKTAPGVKDEKLPLLLRPSDYAVNRAKEMGGDVFKLLPLEDAIQSGSSFGARYSFKNRSYDIPQVEILRGDLRVGDAWNYGFFADLGRRDLRQVDRASREAAYFLSYKPPRLDPDIRSEIERLRDINIDGVNLTRRVTVRVGYTYLLRTINYTYGTDMAVVLHVVESSTDGTVTIIWKELAEFPEPIQLFMPDQEMQTKVDAVLTELQIPGLRVKVEDNRIFVINGKAGPEFEKLKTSLQERKIPYRALGYCFQNADGKIPE